MITNNIFYSVIATHHVLRFSKGYQWHFKKHSTMTCKYYIVTKYLKVNSQLQCILLLMMRVTNCWMMLGSRSNWDEEAPVNIWIGICIMKLLKKWSCSKSTYIQIDLQKEGKQCIYLSFFRLQLYDWCLILKDNKETHSHKCISANGRTPPPLSKNVALNVVSFQGYLPSAVRSNVVRHRSSLVSATLVKSTNFFLTNLCPHLTQQFVLTPPSISMNILLHSICILKGDHSS